MSIPLWLLQRSRRFRVCLGLALGGLCATVAGLSRVNYLSRHLPLPAGISMASPVVPVRPNDVRFLADVTQGDHHEQQIHDRLLELIAGAEAFVLLDAFLWNDYLGQDPGPPFRSLSHELVDALLAKHAQRPNLPIVVISDSINEAYGGAPWPGFERLRAAGILVTLTDHTKLRDSNPAYSAVWRTLLRPLSRASSGGMKHPLSTTAPRVSLGAWLTLLNFKANHRKLLVTDALASDGTGRERVSLVMSANPHDGSSRHGNIALEVRGELWRHLAASEQAVLTFSGDERDLASLIPASAEPVEPVPAGNLPMVQLLTESKIRDALLTGLATADASTRIDMAAFYLSDRRVVDALAAAANRGARVRLLLDPNKDAFGYEKSGIPNRPVAAELRRRTGGAIGIRWFDTTGEQFHAKLVLMAGDGTALLLAGSANFTSRNLGDYNLETDLLVYGPESMPALHDAADWFERLWTNRDRAFSLDYEVYADSSRWRAFVYRMQEATGLGTF